MITYNDFIAKLTESLKGSGYQVYQGNSQISELLRSSSIQQTDSVKEVEDAMQGYQFGVAAFKKRFLRVDKSCVVSKSNMPSIDEVNRYLDCTFYMGLGIAKAIENGNEYKHRVVVCGLASERGYDPDVISDVENSIGKQSSVMLRRTVYNHFGFPVLIDLTNGGVFYFSKSKFLGHSLYSAMHEIVRENFQPSLRQ